MLDLAKITIQAGKGGDGCVSFRREKYVPKGGPDGGDGGKGGNIYFVATDRKNTLLDFKYKREFKAQNGKNGQGSNKTGKSGEDLIIEVPIGTLIRDLFLENVTLSKLNHKEIEKFPIIEDLNYRGKKILIAKGGKGGRGNIHFKSSTNRVPRNAEEGRKGEEKTLFLELKLIADIGIIGFPNAGKSTLLSRLTFANPKIADYPFTTLEPNLGVANFFGRTLIMADIPGLIEGASVGKGLGYEFLRHIQRTKILIHVIAFNEQKHKPLEYLSDYFTLQKEIQSYNQNLDKKPQIVVINKADLPNFEKVYEDLRKAFLKRGIEILKISSIIGLGFEELKRKIILVYERENKSIARLEGKKEIPVITVKDLS